MSELFYSIQGESTFAGMPCVFIRLAGCNLRCSYCDAAYSYEEPGRKVSIDSLLDFVDEYPATMVELTGGEPLLQAGSLQLLDRLVARNRTVLLETNGSLPIADLPAGVHVILDVKCPDSGMAASWLPDNLTAIRRRAAQRPNGTEVKFVVSSLLDYRFARDFIREHDLSTHAPVLFSPVRSRITPAALAAAVLQDRLPVRLQLQLHTLIWPEQTRGV
ncbi:7-carboxy-7-deazaguanine synthase [Desulfoprunum benzoelyticum]|uniref:7-carboxy-7-deazaguanine synthase n=1 Tax=Desulfoprunum benzoelyticum TaxID=1506996 RepID=A0A840UNT9_9BACT|nr:7-carboxy-7-deazaguanine synthase [Desulfoprunum benzoelyticum]